ncbi:MAG: UTP--glucose-1-phosphate uridylyltransferase [Verrucomicrobiae bacterium]|nr:UTP--glucose-1-phosphate uridylyltransferase [Verrucomicrobiae bacterium]
MQLTKAVITAAGKNQRTLPLQSLVDRDGATKTALAIIIGEALSAGIEEIGLVVAPGDQEAFRAAAGAQAGRLRFIEQTEPLGYGHAVWCAREFVGGASFLLLVGDHLYVSAAESGCARQLVEVARAADAAVSAVQATHESKLPFYGAVGGRRVAGPAGCYEVSEVLEKPTPTEAEQRLVVPGLRAGHYLCFFGMHALTPGVMDVLGELVADRSRAGGIHLSAALNLLARKERYLAFEARGRRYDIGARYGLLTAQLALALDGADREEVLASLVELLAQRAR